MKTILRILGLATVLVSEAAMAQHDYKPFRVGLGFGLIAPQKTPPLSGFLLYLEPSLRVHNNYSIGFRVETAGMLYADVGILGSYTINGQYYFKEGPTRIFGGLGFGAYTVNSAPLASCTCENEIGATIYGFYPRVGIELSHFVMMLEFNFVQTAKQVAHYSMPMPMMNSEPSYYQATTSYGSLKVGWYIGGGRKKKN